MTALRRRLTREESGFTLVELLTAVTIGTIITIAAFGLLDSSVRAFKKNDERVDVDQRARVIMDVMGQTLRSQVCGPSTAASTQPIAQATDTSVSFWADTTGQRTSRTTAIDANRKLVGYSFASNNLYSLSYAGTDVNSTLTQKVLLTNVIPAISSGVAFQYWQFNPTYDASATSGANSQLYTQLTTPVAATSLANIVKITVTFKAYPTGQTSSSKNSLVLNNEFNSRTSDPFSQDPPDC